MKNRYHTAEFLSAYHAKVMALWDKDLTGVLADLLTCVPSHIADYLAQNCLIVYLKTGTKHQAGCLYRAPQIDGRDVIVLAEEVVLYHDANVRNRLILHELAHCWLKHEHEPIVVNEQVQLQQKKQEKEANDLAAKWYRRFKSNDQATRRIT